jgi:hypothetical protein
MGTIAELKKLCTYCGKFKPWDDFIIRKRRICNSCRDLEALYTTEAKSKMDALEAGTKIK